MDALLVEVLNFLTGALAALTQLCVAHPYAAGLPIFFGPTLFCLFSTRSIGASAGLLIPNLIAAAVIAVAAEAGAMAYLALWALAFLLAIAAFRRRRKARLSPTAQLDIDDLMIGRHG